MKKKVDILLPCYNEEKVLGECIDRINRVIKKDKKHTYSIIVCDNNSTDKSIDIAKKKATVIVEKEVGYGATLLNGIKTSKADYLVMLDCDLSYDETDIPKFIDELDQGNDMVIGNRYRGGIEKGAMSIDHKIGVKFLTEYANLLFHTKSHDYHCGLRVFRRDKILLCDLQSKGFEFASEMIIKAKINHLKIKEVPTKLFVDGRNGKSHLKTIRDGLRHLHLINKLKYENSIIFRYFTTYLLILLFMISLVLISCSIPQKYVRENSIKSMTFLEEFYNSSKKSEKYSTFEKIGDIRNIAIAYQMDSDKIVDSSIRMSYLEDVDYKIKMDKVLEENKGKVINYSRYWQGQAVYSKFMLLITPLSYMFYIIQLIILIILFLYLSYKLFKKDKILGISFVIGNMCFNMLFTAFSVQYYFAVLLSYVFSLIILSLYEKKSRYVGLLFAVSGMLTCFFDFLTCETLTLTLPLFIYEYLCIKDGNKRIIPEIIKYVMIWGIFYSLTFLTKWLIDCLYFGFDYFNVIREKAFIRVGEKVPFYLEGWRSIIRTLRNILPFAKFKYGIIYLLSLLVISVYLMVFDYRKYFGLLIISLIPICRIFLLHSHSYMFHYFVYRALCPFMMLIIVMIVDKIINVLKKNNN